MIVLIVELVIFFENFDGDGFVDYLEWSIVENGCVKLFIVEKYGVKWSFVENYGVKWSIENYGVKWCWLNF